jgi:DNA-binding CsgD family transcriptional regulator
MSAELNQVRVAGFGGLLGRDRELGALYELIDGIELGGGVALVRGEAGIGKTALLQAASVRALERGSAVTRAIASESESPLAFAGLHQLLKPYMALLSELPEPQSRALESAFGLVAGERPDVFLIGLATLGLLSSAATGDPVLALVEDAHWLDAASAQVLAFVGRRLEDEPVVLLASVRDGVPSVFDNARLPELHISGLDDDAARALLDLHAHELSADLKRRVLDEAAGNPLALLELPLAVSALGDDSVLPMQPLPLTARLEQAFAVRLDTLSDETRTLLLLAALDDGKLAQLNAAAQLLDCPATEENWLEAVNSRLGALSADGFRFRHPLVRSAVHHAAGPEELRYAHGALAQAFASDLDRAVWHRAAAATGLDAELAGELVAMADRAASRGATDVSVSALERAAQLTSDPSHRALRLFRAGDMAGLAGHVELSSRLLRGAQRLGLGPYEQAIAYFQLERSRGVWLGSPDEIRRFVRLAEDLIGRGEGGRAVDILLRIASSAAWSNLDEETRAAAAAVIEASGTVVDDPSSLNVLACFDPVRSARKVRAGVERWSLVDSLDPRQLLSLGMAAAYSWSQHLALPFLQASEAAFRASGEALLLANTLALEAWVNLRLGFVVPATISAAECASFTEEAGQVTLRYNTLLAQGIAAADSGDDETADSLIAEGERGYVGMGARWSLAVYARGRQALMRERYADAYLHFIRVFDPADVAYSRFTSGSILADLADAAVHGSGDLEKVSNHLRAWEQIALRSGAPSLRAQLDYAIALVADDADADDAYEAAGASTAGVSPLLAGRVQLAHGDWLRRQRRSREARGRLRAAVDTFDALGQTRLAERARRELRAAGENVGARAREAWWDLTPQELQIAQMAADGLSNREIGERLYLSPRTISTHLYRLFPKLGVTSRTQLASALGATGKR